MTDTVAPEVTPDATPEVTKAAPPEMDSLSPMAKMILELSLKDRFARALEIAEAQKATENVGETLQKAIEASKNKRVVELRTKVEEANQFIIDATKSMEDTVRPTLNLPSDEEIAKQDEEFKALASEIATYADVFATEVKKDYPELTVYDYYPALPGKKKGAKQGQGQGTSRPRVKKIEYTTDLAGEQGYKAAEKDGKSTFSVLAQAFKSATDGVVDVSASDLHEAWTSQYGGKDWSDLPDVTKFTYSAAGKEGKSFQWTVRVTK
jgi:hypothetical protein